MVNKVRTLDFIPEIFRTETNRQFLSASLDILTSQPDLVRTEGFIGEKYGYGIEPNDKYVVEPTKTRTDYQLDPGVVFLKPDTQTPQDFINYPGIINALKNNDAIVDNHDRLWRSQFYSWDPFIDIDKVVNYSQYYWMPNGPAAITISTETVYLTAEYNVVADDNGYKFSELPDQTNPTITLLRGGTYTFTVPAGSTNFWIQSVPGVEATVGERTVTGVTNNGTDAGIISWTVPDKATLNQDVFYYQSGTDTLSVGVIKLIETNSSNKIDVADILGKKNYTSPNDVRFTNGLRVTFESNVVPSSYASKIYYVEGVGSSIVLLPASMYVASEVSGLTIYNPWSINPWDIDVWDAQLYVPYYPEYITINRNSRDYNAWTRSNRWFHEDVIKETTKALGYATLPSDPPSTRAQRPIIEYRGNLKLFNAGTIGLGPVSLVDTSTTDAFSTIEGQPPGSVPAIDGVAIAPGLRIIFTADTNPAVRKNVYTIQFLPIGPANALRVALIPDNSITVADNTEIWVLDGQEYTGSSWRFEETTNNWLQAQKKTVLNQYPLYDVFDQQGISFGDSLVYSSTTFQGVKLFSYTPGTGGNDPVLGFPIAYSSVSTIGDILFTINFNSENFEYAPTPGNFVSAGTNSGFIHYYYAPALYENLTGWVTAAGPSFQYQVFEFPVNTEDKVSFRCDVPYKTNTPWRSVVVYLNDDVLDSDAYTYDIDLATNETVVYFPSPAGAKVTILVISDQPSKTAYYEIPNNLENNPFNENLVSVAVGDLKNQYRSIFTNAPDTIGQTFGYNNLHDLGNLNNYGTAIIQNSASLVLPGVFLRKPQANFFQALQFNSDSYTLYKQLIIDLAFKGDFNVYQTPSDILDSILFTIGATRTSTDAFFWSDMLFSGNPERISTYTIATQTNSATFALNRVYNFTSANYYSVAVYLTNVNTGQTIQLIKDQDYTVSSTSPSLVINYSLAVGDIVTIKEYNQTYGSFCPNTPTKIGLYPKTIPSVVYDESYIPATWFIVGHDGSQTRLYGNYDPVTQRLDDFRDVALLEFEKRVYNNMKVTGSIPLMDVDVIPGQFRTTDYTWQEILDIYSINFLNWVGVNRIDYKIQYYNLLNQFSYNYNQSGNRLSSGPLLQGYWRGIYRYFYDTNNPARAPWKMLGFTDEPSWWTTRYGPAPYTSGNTYMWTEISQGYIWNGGAPYVDPARIRPGLLNVLPVDGLGNIISPFDSVMGNYNKLTFDKDWVVGDGAPAESAYLRSSTWCFDLMKLLALTKPANFFNLFADRDLYKYSAEFNQYLYDNRYYLDPTSLQVYGNGLAKHSYINWVVDYNYQRGANGTDAVTELLRNLDVRLIYNMAGFTAKNYLKFLIEKATANSKNSSLLIPDESYSVLLYDNPASELITYSSVIVQKTQNGYSVTGNSKNIQVFTTVQPQAGLWEKVTVGNVTVELSKTFDTEKTITVPYGSQYYSLQSVAEFINNYGKYLTKQGVQFTNIEDGVELNWIFIIQEFLAWAQQDWEIGTIINLNPAAQVFEVYRPGLVVQPLNLHSQNFLLNQNLLPIQQQDISIYRDNEKFGVKILNEGDTVAYTNLSLNSINHAIVFDNSTIFNDTIYNLVTGLRQSRLLLQGYKTGNWQGYVNTSGFILNEDNVQEWQPNVKYPKNIIVKYKQGYYTARKLIEPNEKFSQEDWLLTDYELVKTGLLPNPSTIAYEALWYYDTTRANLENDVDLLGFSLIGFRPRDYLNAADLNDITQINVYKNIIKTKGTPLLADTFKNAELARGTIDYVINEIWSIKTSDFGAVLNSNFVECALDSSLLISNPSILAFTDSSSVAPQAQQVVNINNLVNYERKPVNGNFLPALNSNDKKQPGLPSAGYVNLNDAKIKEYVITDFNLDSENYTSLYANDTVWVANYERDWNIFQAVSLNTTLIRADNNLNGTVTLTFSGFHGLTAGERIVVVNFVTDINGYHAVKSVPTLTTIVIDITLIQNTYTAQGIVFKLPSVRYEQASDIAANLLPNTAWTTRKAWVDMDTDGNWAVYAASPVYKQQSTKLLPGGFGYSVAYTSALGLLVSNGSGTLYRYAAIGPAQILTSSGSGSGTQVIAWNEYAWVSDPDNDKVHVYEYDSVNKLLVKVQEITVINTGAIAASQDRLWLYVGDSNSQTVYVYLWTSGAYVLVSTLNDISVPLSSQWAATLATSREGDKLVVGAPAQTINALNNAGAVYVYARRVQNFWGDGTTTVYTLANGLPIGNYALVYQNDSLLTSGYTITLGTTLTFSTPPELGDVVAVHAANLDKMQMFVSENPQINAYFGTSVDTNRYGAEIVVGAPDEITQINDFQNVQGSVYRFTNSGQRYGIITGDISSAPVGQMFLNGYLISLAGLNIDTFIAAVNANYTNVTAAKVGSTGFILTVKENSPTVLYNQINLVADSTVLASLNIVGWTQTQKILNPDLTDIGRFGNLVRLNNTDSAIVSSPNQTRLSPTTFDNPDGCVADSTIFDNNATVWIDQVAEQGVVYEYTYLPAYNENILNPGKYTFGQYIITQGINSSTPQPQFGFSVYYNDSTIAVSTPYWSTAVGGAALFTTSWTPSSDCQVVRPTSWYIDKKPLTQVDIHSLGNISIYNRIDNQTLDYLDYIDPVQGKLLGAIRPNIDYLDVVDPASYNLSSLNWTWDHVGDTWLNLDTIRILDTHQPDITYNSTHWGKAFPGSTAEVYTWIASGTSPTDYTGPGFPVYFDTFNTSTGLDKATNSLKTTYYFWVKNYNELPAGKNLSPLVLSSYLLNPQTSGISYLAPLATNTVALYNSLSSIQANTAVLNLGYGIEVSEDNKHTNWLLIKQEDPAAFLNGLPSADNSQPTALYLKFIQSFSGYDNSGNPVPNPSLPVQTRSGVNFRPRQSMFYDRFLALKNYILYANSILIQYPIAETRDLTYINLFGPLFDTREWWDYVNWWATGYDNNTKPATEVTELNDILPLVAGDDLTGSNGATVIIEDGIIIKVHQNDNAQAEYYTYYQASGWVRIGLQNGTIQFKPGIYESFGWESTPWGLIWDDSLSDEIYWIIRWLNEKCYISDLEIERNRSLILMFKFIQSEPIENSNYLPWLNKTSLIDIRHKIRDLLPYKNFQRDNQEFLSGFINEIKPFHVYIKDFVFTYPGQDVYAGNITDFDLPVEYNTLTNKFVTPNLVYDKTVYNYNYDSAYWEQQNYRDWYNNFGLSIKTENTGFMAVSQLRQSITFNATTAYLTNITNLPVTGTIQIGSELITYEAIDYTNFSLLGLNRGTNDTVASAHTAGDEIYCDFAPVIVVDHGRNYVEPPRINVVIDTLLYPAPRRDAILAPVMSLDKLIGVRVIDPGEGYVVQPDIMIDPSMVVTFTSADVDVFLNYIVIVGHDFQDGDLVIYTTGAGSAKPGGLTEGEYYYVRNLSVNTIALYTTPHQATAANTQLGSNDGRINFTSAGVGNNLILSLTARAICFTDSAPVRELDTTLQFNRVSYNSVVTVWVASGSYTQAQLVTYLGSLYECLIANTDSTFQVPNSVTTLVSIATISRLANVVTVVTGSGHGLVTGNYIDVTEVTGFNGEFGPVTVINGTTFTYAQVGANASASTGIVNRAEKWASVPSDDPRLTAADLVAGYYKPTLSMPANSLNLVSSGVEYPNAVILSYSFTETSGVLDALVQATAFTDTSVPDYTFQGGEFLDGYAPEELVAGVVFDFINITVISDYSAPPVSSPDPLNFRIAVDRWGNQSTYNVNPFTQTTLSAPFISTGSSSDVISVVDASILVYPGQTSGILLLNNEFILFNSINLVGNTVTNLTRGIYGTVTNLGTIVAGTTVQSQVVTEMLPIIYSDQWWYGAPTSPSANTTLLTNTNPAAVFLQTLS